MTTYSVISQDLTTGKIVESKTYDNLPYARIHYNALDIRDYNRLICTEHQPNADVITVLEETA